MEHKNIPTNILDEHIKKHKVLEAFKDGVADACLRGIRDDEQSHAYYKQGYDFGMTLYADMIERTIV